MAEQIEMLNGTRAEKYKHLQPQIESLLAGEADMIACMANFSAALKIAMDFHWVGFYVVKGDDLVLGPFQGPVACTRIAKGKGVCGAARASGEPLVVPDVDLFPGHIACSAESRSEIVVPLKKDRGTVWGVLDVDSRLANDFDDTDAEWLSVFCAILEKKYRNT